MKEIEGVKFYTVAEVCERVGRSAQTIRLWFKAKSIGAEGLVQQKLLLPSEDNGGLIVYNSKNYYREAGIKMLTEYRNSIENERGSMAHFNSKFKWKYKTVKAYKHCDRDVKRISEDDEAIDEYHEKSKNKHYDNL
jgi:predicted transcriptional regulator